MSLLNVEVPLTVKSEDTDAVPVIIASMLVNFNVSTLVPPEFKQLNDIVVETPPVGAIENIWPD